MTAIDTLPARPAEPRALARHQIATLRAEGIASLALSIGLFASTGVSWWLFAALILVPDVSALGYLANHRTGAIGYNIAHSLILPAVIIMAGVTLALPFLTALGAIWWAHIGMDRAVGYGLKSLDDPRVTHLSWGQ